VDCICNVQLAAVDIYDDIAVTACGHAGSALKSALTSTVILLQAAEAAAATGAATLAAN